MRKLFALFFGIVLFLFFAPQVKAANLVAGDLIKASQDAVYYYGTDGKRYVFPNEKTYKTWYSDFSAVKTITDAELAAISIGGNATYKGGVKMVKITTDPKVYAVAEKGTLRWIKTETAAAALYGVDWNIKVDDVPDAFFVNYTVGADIVTAEDFDKTAAMALDIIGPAAAVPCSGCGSQAPPAVTYLWNIKTINPDVYYHRGLSFGNFNNGFTATWYDDRNGQNEIFYQTADLSAAGSGAAVRVSNNITDSTNCASAFDGTNSYFVWEDSSPLKRAIYLQKYDINGNQLVSRLFTSSTFATSKYPEIAWNSALNKYGIVWWDTKAGSSGAVGNLYFSFVTQGGLKTGAELIVSETASTDFRPYIVEAGDKFAVIWQGDDKIIKFALINSLSVVAGGGVKNAYTAGEVVSPKLAWNGGGFGAVWSEKIGNDKNVYFIKLESGGNPVGGKVALTSGAGDATEPDILWGGERFYVAYTNYKLASQGGASDVRVLKIDKAGIADGAAKSVSTVGANAYSPGLAKSGAVIGAAWLENGGTTNKIMSAVETKN